MKPDQLVWHRFDEPVVGRWPAGNMPAGRLLRDAGGVVQLVGHLNELAGVCDDCTDHTTWVEYCDDLRPLVESLAPPEATL